VTLPGLSPALRRGLLSAGLAILVLVLVGATYQGVATALERQRYEYPGRLIPIGDHQLHLYCEGDGSPLVVLEAPEAGMSAAWGHVQAALALRTRVCSYDRSGLGWSESGDTAYAPADVPANLRTLLANAGERPPFVVAGAGLGAAFARRFAADYPREVVALVTIEPIDAARPDGFARLVAAAPWLARIGVLRLSRRLSRLADGLPEPAADRLATFLNRPDHLTRAAAELARWDEAAALADAGGAPVPVVRIAPPDGDPPAWLASPEAAAPVIAALQRAVDDARAAAAPEPPE